MTAGPFFVSRRDVGLGSGSPSVVLDMDKMACYVAEKVQQARFTSSPLHPFKPLPLHLERLLCWCRLA